MTWCIHNACKIRDKAQRPSAFKSQPSGRLTCSTPELGAQLNLTNDQKRKGTIPASTSFCLIMWACRTCGQSLEQHSKKERCCRSFQLCRAKWTVKKVEAQYCGQLFNTLTSANEKRKRVRPSTAASSSTQRHRRVRQGKKGRLFTLLKRITNSKV